jgi:hypothetical protein
MDIRVRRRGPYDERLVYLFDRTDSVDLLSSYSEGARAKLAANKLRPAARPEQNGFFVESEVILVLLGAFRT